MHKILVVFYIWFVALMLGGFGLALAGVRQAEETARTAEYYEYGESESHFSIASDLVRQYRIAQEELDAMTNEELAQAVADYPLLTTSTGISAVTGGGSSTLRQNCDAYNELLQRDGGIIALLDKEAQVIGSRDDMLSEELGRLLKDALVDRLREE